MKYRSEIKLEQHSISKNDPVFFIADIAASHDGELNRAIDLIHMAAEAGAHAAKFQHFTAETIVSNFGFESLGSQKSHQASWKKSVFQVYKEASVDLSWTMKLKEACKQAGIVFFTSPYSFELVDALDPDLAAYKIGSGDITWLELIEHIAKKNKPVFIATGASNTEEVVEAMDIITKFNADVCLMQCNTNYTASLENFKCIQLNVLKTYAAMFPDLILGLSDHTPGHATVLGAVALGARVIEKHFTDDCNRVGPDHRFSMDPKSWKEMVERTRELQLALGDGIKRVEGNEKETHVLQRRAWRLKINLPAGSVIQMEHLFPLRPSPEDAIPMNQLKQILGKTVKKDLVAGDYLRWNQIS